MKLTLNNYEDDDRVRLDPDAEEPECDAEVVFDTDHDDFTIRPVFLNVPSESKSGKRLIIASTGGSLRTPYRFKGQDVYVTAKAFVKIPKSQRKSKGSGK